MQDGVPELSDEAVKAWARLVRVSQTVLSKVEADLTAAGLPSLSWYDALLELKRAAPAGLRPFQLQDRMLLTQYNMSRLATRLVKAGYIEREDCSEDGRGQVLKLTEDGRTLLSRMWPVYRKAIAEHFANRLDDREVAIFTKALAKLE